MRYAPGHTKILQVVVLDERDGWTGDLLGLAVTARDVIPLACAREATT